MNCVDDSVHQSVHSIIYVSTYLNTIVIDTMFVQVRTSSVAVAHLWRVCTHTEDRVHVDSRLVAGMQCDLLCTYT